MKFHLSLGWSSGNIRVLAADILGDAHTAQNTIASSSATDKYYTKPVMPVTLSTTNYGLGWRIGHYRGKALTIRPCRLNMSGL